MPDRLQGRLYAIAAAQHRPPPGQTVTAPPPLHLRTSA